jgi:RecB family endonuclease NucS
LYELKKDIAKPQALDQVKGYMKKSIKKYKIDADKIKGVILAKSIDPELSKALKNEPDIEAKTYFFSIGMKK